MFLVTMNLFMNNKYRNGGRNMFCSKCGKQIEDKTKFCPHCGNKITSSNMGNIADSVKKATDTALNMAQSAKNAANAATNGQAEKYVEKAKETAQGFVNDAKQVAKDKDTSSFLKKNNYKNLKILSGLVVVICLLLGVFNGDKGEKLAKNVVSASYSDCKIKSVTKAAESNALDIHIYVVKFIPSNEDEHSALVRVSPDMNFATIDGVYSKNRYSELDKEIESWKMVIKMGSQ